MARSDAPFSQASQKRRGDLRCVQGTEIPNLDSGAPPELGLREMVRECLEPGARSFGKAAATLESSQIGLPKPALGFYGDFPGNMTSYDDTSPGSPPLRTAAARERREVKQVSRRPRAQLAGASRRGADPRRRAQGGPVLLNPQIAFLKNEGGREGSTLKSSCSSLGQWRLSGVAKKILLGRKLGVG